MDRIKVKNVFKRTLSIIMVAIIIAGYFPVQKVSAENMGPILDNQEVLYANKNCSLCVTKTYSDGASTAEFQSVEPVNPRSKKRGRIFLDEGVDLWINTRYANEVIIRRQYGADDSGSNMIATGEKENYKHIYNATRIDAATYFDYDYLHDIDDRNEYLNYGKRNSNYLLTVYEEGKVDLDNPYAVKTEFEVFIRRNSICLFEDETNATIKTDYKKMFVKADEEVRVTNAYKIVDINNGQYNERSIGNYSENGASIISINTESNNGIARIKTGKVIGNTGTISWSNRSGTTCSIPVQVSNMVNPYLGQVRGINNAKIEAGSSSVEIWPSLGSVEIKRNVYTTGTSPCEIELKMDSIVAGGSPDYDNADFQVEDTTGCLSTLAYHVTGNTMNLTIVPSKFGMITIKWKDYMGRLRSENWKVQFVTKAEFDQKEDTQCEQDIIDGEAEKSDSTTGQDEALAQVVGQGNMGDYPSDSNSDSNNQGDNSKEPTYIPPEIEFLATSYGSERVKFDVKTYNATDAMWQIRRRVLDAYGKIISEYEAPSSVYSNNGGWGASNPSAYSFNLDVNEFGEGYFDVTMIAKNVSDYVTNWIAMGPIRLLKGPTIDYTCNRENDNRVIFNFTTANATNAKYFIRKRNQNEDGSLEAFAGLGTNENNYAAIEGTSVDSADNFTVTVEAPKNKRGYYDVVAIAKNKDDDVYDYVAIGPVYVNSTPEAVVETVDISDSSSKTFKPNYIDLDEDSCDLYYFIEKKDEVTDYVQPSKDTIIAYGRKDNEKENIQLSKENNGTGYYDISVLTVDPAGAYNIAYLSNIPISEAPTIESYTINGERGNSSEGFITSTQKRNKQILTLKLKDTDVNDNVNVYYFVSEQDLEEENLFKSKENFLNGAGNSMVELQWTAQSTDIEITIEPDEGKESEKYLYIMMQDKYGGASYYKAGTFLVDDTELKLEGVDIVKQQKELLDSKKYGIGDELQIMLQFNHKMEENAPDLYIKIGDLERKQDAINYDDNKVIYSYGIEKNGASGAVQIARVDYSNKSFKDTYTPQNTYNKQIGQKNIQSEIDNYDENAISYIQDNQYLVDSVEPTISSIEINLVTDDTITRKNDLENHKIFLSGVKNGSIVVKYSEDIIGIPQDIQVIAGNNSTSWITSNGEGKRTQDEYSLKDFLEMAKKTEGEIQVLSISAIKTIMDEYGNELNADNYNVEYKLNGESVGDNKIIVDNYINECKITKNIYTADDNVNIDNISNIQDGEVLNVGSVVNCFDEYSRLNPQDYKDLSGVENIRIIVYNNAPVVIMEDRFNHPLLKANAESNDGIFQSMVEFEINENQLPIKLELRSAGEYRIMAVKKDNMGNVSSNVKNVTATDSIVIDSEKTGFKLLSNDVLYNALDMSGFDREYEIYLKNSLSTSMDSVSVTLKDVNGNEKSAIFKENRQIEGVNYSIYSCSITYGGKYVVRAINEDSDVLLTQKTITVDNLYALGDTNNDGFINSQDVTLLLKYIVNKVNNKYIRKAGDINNDDSVDVRDAVLLCRVVAGDPKLHRLPNGQFEVLD